VEDLAELEGGDRPADRAAQEQPGAEDAHPDRREGEVGRAQRLDPLEPDQSEAGQRVAEQDRPGVLAAPVAEPPVAGEEVVADDGAPGHRAAFAAAAATTCPAARRSSGVSTSAQSASPAMSAPSG